MHHPRLWAFIILVITALSSAQDAVDDPKKVADDQCEGMLGAEEDGPLCSTVYLPYGHNCGVGSYTAKFPCTADGSTSYIEVLAKCCCQPCKALSCPKRCELKYVDESYILLSQNCSNVAPNNGEVPFTRKTNMKQPICIDPCPKYKYIQRFGWCARTVKLTTKFAESPKNVYVYQTGLEGCRLEAYCQSRVREIQAHNIDNENKVDIVYNFLIGGDGNAYVGRGWNYVGEHNTNATVNENSIGVTFIGDFTTSDPDEAFSCALKKLVTFGMLKEKIPADVRQVCNCGALCDPKEFECDPITWHCNCVACNCKRS